MTEQTPVFTLADLIADAKAFRNETMGLCGEYRECPIAAAAGRKFGRAVHNPYGVGEMFFVDTVGASHVVITTDFDLMRVTTEIDLLDSARAPISGQAVLDVLADLGLYTPQPETWAMTVELEIPVSHETQHVFRASYTTAPNKQSTGDRLNVLGAISPAGERTVKFSVGNQVLTPADAHNFAQTILALLAKMEAEKA